MKGANGEDRKNRKVWRPREGRNSGGTLARVAEMWKIVKTEELLSDSAIQRSLPPLSGADSEGGG